VHSNKIKVIASEVAKRYVCSFSSSNSEHSILTPHLMPS